MVWLVRTREQVKKKFLQKFECPRSSIHLGVKAFGKFQAEPYNPNNCYMQNTSIYLSDDKRSSSSDSVSQYADRLIPPYCAMHLFACCMENGFSSAFAPAAGCLEHTMASPLLHLNLC